MNIKQASTDYLVEIVREHNARVASGAILSAAERTFYEACRREVARRWGIRL